MVGRSKEVKELEKRYNSAQSEFVAIYGRRRIGRHTLFVRRSVIALRSRIRELHAEPKDAS